MLIGVESFLASMQQDESCIERERDKPSKLQSSMYYALDGDQVNILIMLAQKCEDFWVSILCDNYH